MSRVPTGKGATGKPHRKSKAHLPIETLKMGLTDPAIRRLARRAGVVRIRGACYDNTRNRIDTDLTRFVKIEKVFLETGKRKTVTVADVQKAFKRLGMNLFI